MKKAAVAVVLIAVIYSLIISCSKSVPNGPVSVGKIPLTPTPTYTPDINFTVYIHQEETPAAGVDVEMYSIDDGITFNSATDETGKAGFKINSGGKWSVVVGSFKGFKHQYFMADPMSNTILAVDYGIPYLDMELIEGSEKIPIEPNTIKYKITYHTKFEREDKVDLKNFENLLPVFSNPNIIKNEGDAITCTLDIPKSFEDYGEDRKHLNIWAYCTNDETLKSGERTLEKNWMLNITALFQYAAVYDYVHGFTSFYAGIKEADLSTSYNIPFTGTIKYKAVNAANTGNAGMVKWFDPGKCMPGFTSYGCFNALARIETNKGSEYVWMNHNNNNGCITVRIYDDAHLDVERTFSTERYWNTEVCMHWCCTSDHITRATRECFTEGRLPFMMCTFVWDSPKTADVYREKHQRINISY